MKRLKIIFSIMLCDYDTYFFLYTINISQKNYFHYFQTIKTNSKIKFLLFIL